ncbi:hypothetical protein C8R46DRAFT_1313345 [Mycena filopes]|nr:hypothetical protein C8R46DRAFT_1313345 [Mycena filopes]
MRQDSEFSTRKRGLALVASQVINPRNWQVAEWLSSPKYHFQTRTAYICAYALSDQARSDEEEAEESPRNSSVRARSWDNKWNDAMRTVPALERASITENGRKERMLRAARDDATPTEMNAIAGVGKMCGMRHPSEGVYSTTALDRICRSSEMALRICTLEDVLGKTFKTSKTDFRERRTSFTRQVHSSFKDDSSWARLRSSWVRHTYSLPRLLKDLARTVKKHSGHVDPVAYCPAPKMPPINGSCMEILSLRYGRVNDLEMKRRMMAETNLEGLDLVKDLQREVWSLGEVVCGLSAQVRHRAGRRGLEVADLKGLDMLMSWRLSGAGLGKQGIGALERVAGKGTRWGERASNDVSD